MLAGDEFYDDEVTSGPIEPEPVECCGVRPAVFHGSPCGYGRSHPVHSRDRDPLGIPFKETDRHEFADPYWA